MEIQLFGLAVAPGIAIAIYVYFRDRYEKEPLNLLFKCFLAGFIAIVPAALIESILMNGFLPGRSLADIAVKNFLFVGFTEEFIKFIVLYRIVFRRPEFNEPFDGIVYAAMVSMGFATSENILYVLEGGINVAVARIFTAIPAHASFSILMGYFVGLAKFHPRRYGYLGIGLITATLFHGAYDFFLSMDNMEMIALGAFVSLIIGIRLSFKAMTILNEHSPFRYSQMFKLKTTRDKDRDQQYET